MKCINCGKEIPPDTAECPYCLEKESRIGSNQRERHKIYITLSICILVLGIIAAAVLIFMPDTSFQRSMENAEGSYALAALCEESPIEAGDSRYQLRLLDAVDDINNRYSNQTCGYNQTVTALRQMYSVENEVVRDRVKEVWADVERMRFYQLLKSKRSAAESTELTWNADIAAAAETIADEYDAVGLDYQQNAERLIKNLLPDDIESITVSTLINTVNAQDALVKYEEDSDQSKGNDLLYGEDITEIGVDAVYNEETGMWSFFILTA